MVTQNLSAGNAFVRFAAGTSMLAFGIASISRRPSCNRGRATILMGATKMAEGIFRYCPAKAVMQKNMQSTVTDMFSGGSPDMTKIMQDFAKIVREGSAGTGTNTGLSDTAAAVNAMINEGGDANLTSITPNAANLPRDTKSPASTHNSGGLTSVVTSAAKSIVSGNNTGPSNVGSYTSIIKNPS